MSGVVTAVAIAGTLASVVGSVVQGQQQAAAAQAQAQAQAQNYNFQQQAYQYQSNVEKMNADSAHEQAAQQEDLQRRRFRELQAQSITGMAESGTDPMSGSNLDVLHQNAVNNELDALNIRYAGEQQARGLLAQSSLDSWNANVAGYNEQAAINTGNMTANSAKMGGYFGAGAGLLSGATNVASTGKNMGAW
jgi:type II secretory pathway pseudopilin PulG